VSAAPGHAWSCHEAWGTLWWCVRTSFNFNWSSVCSAWSCMKLPWSVRYASVVYDYKLCFDFVRVNGAWSVAVGHACHETQSMPWQCTLDCKQLTLLQQIVNTAALYRLAGASLVVSAQRITYIALLVPSPCSCYNFSCRSSRALIVVR